jgi:myo-inositol-1(or 4)-monophosphatase
MLEAVAQSLRSVAREEIMPRYLRVAHSRKADGSLCTEADLATQAALTHALTAIAAYPLLGEEMPPDMQETHWQSGKAGLWCVDPIDGTSNFVNGLPYFAVSVALFREGRPVLGAVYDPVADELFCAEAGQGAWLNDESLPIKTYVPDLRHCLAGVAFKRLNRRLAAQLASSPPFMSQRNFGASSLDWCYVAAGRFDIYLHGSQKLWDYAAGSLILAEAGGRMCTLESDDFWAGEEWDRSVIAALNEDLFHGWRNWVRSATQA